MLKDLRTADQDAQLRTATDAHPFPDEARAAAALAANCKHWGEELAAAARTLESRAAQRKA